MATQNDELDAPAGSVEQQNVRIDPTTKRLLTRLAAAKGMTSAQYCAVVLMEHVGLKSKELLEIHREDARRAREFERSLQDDVAQVVRSAESALSAAGQSRKRRSRVDA